MTSVTATDGLTATPNPITTTGSVGIAAGGVTNDMLAGGIANAKLQNSSVTVTAGTGLSGGGSVALGSSTTLNNEGVLSFNSRTGAVSATSGDYSFSLISGTATTSQLPATTAYTNAANAFTANQSIAGNLSLTGSGSLSIAGGSITLPDTAGATTGVLNLGDGNWFLHGFGGLSNTFVGRSAGNFTMGSGVEGGDFNTAVGSSALFSNTTGFSNTALGPSTLVLNTSGFDNTALGVHALFDNKTGQGNTAVGAHALQSNQAGPTTDPAFGSLNTALGNQALFGNTTGSSNTASGAFALRNNTTGNLNTASGANALSINTGGTYNTASGAGALSNNTTGTGNTASGAGALSNNTTGFYNIAIGYSAGASATTGNYNIYIGNSGLTAEGNTIRIGDSNQTRTFIAGILGVTTDLGGAVPVLVDSIGQLGTTSSSRRFKYDVKEMDQASAKLLQLRPVTFRYKQSQNDGSHPLQYGLIAEEVADIYPELVQKSPEGEANAVLYHVLPAMLLNEFQKQHQQIEAQQALIQSLQEQLAQLASQSRQLQAEMAALKGNRDSGSEIAAVAIHP